MNQAHWHLLLNHLPVLGTLFGLLLLTFSIIRKNEELRRTALLVFVLSAIVTIPVFLTGEPAEKIVENLPGVSEALIERHEDAAKLALIANLLTGAAGLIGLVLAWKKPRLASATTVTALALALVTSGLMGWTASLGGQIRHTEIRAEFASLPATEGSEGKGTEGGIEKKAETPNQNTSEGKDKKDDDED